VPKSFGKKFCHAFSGMLSVDNPASPITSSYFDTVHLPAFQSLSQRSDDCMVTTPSNEIKMPIVGIGRKIAEEDAAILTVVVCPH
jgi:hypothetical protein